MFNLLALTYREHVHVICMADIKARHGVKEDFVLRCFIFLFYFVAVPFTWGGILTLSRLVKL